MSELHEVRDDRLTRGEGRVRSTSCAALVFSALSAFLAWGVAYWGIPSGAFAISSALCCSIAVSSLQSSKRVGLLCLACVIMGAIATYFWNQAWSPDAGAELLGGEEGRFM